MFFTGFQFCWPRNFCCFSVTTLFSVAFEVVVFYVWLIGFGSFAWGMWVVCVVWLVFGRVGGVVLFLCVIGFDIGSRTCGVSMLFDVFSEPWDRS